MIKSDNDFDNDPWISARPLLGPLLNMYTASYMSVMGTRVAFSLPALVKKQLLGNVFKTFQNGWILVEMLSFLLKALANEIKTLVVGFHS